MPLMVRTITSRKARASRIIRVRQAAQAAQHLDLDVIQGVDIRIAQLDGVLGDRLKFHQGLVPADGQDCLAGAFIFRADGGENTTAPGRGP